MTSPIDGKWKIKAISKCLVYNFTMITAINLGEIHHAIKNDSKYQKCMQHLLSTMMFVFNWPNNSNYSNKELEDFF
jgi:hypothetical protein